MLYSEVRITITSLLPSDTGRMINPNDITPSPSLSALDLLSIHAPSPAPSDASADTIRVRPHIRDFVNSPGPLTPESYERPASSYHAQTPPPDHKLQPDGLRSSRSSLRERSADNRSRRASSNLGQEPLANAESSQVREIERSESRLSRSSSGKSTSTIRPLTVLLRPATPQSTNSETEPTETPRKSKLASLASSRALESRTKTLSQSSSFVSTGSNITYPVLRPSPLSFNNSRSSLTESGAWDAPTSPDSVPITEPTGLERPPAPTPSHPQQPPEDLAPPPTSHAPSSAKSPSKLSLLAKSKASEIPPKMKKPKVLGPPYAHTKYLSSTSNSSAMTTAITTYIQTPDNMLSLAKARLPPSYPPEISSFGGSGKQSKLALKAKNLQKQSLLTNTVGSDISEEPRMITLDPIYERKQRTSSATPSPFASLLVDDRYNRSQAKAALAENEQDERKRRKQRKNALLPTHLLSPSPSTGSTGFAFDVPSPDDVVISARRGTALGSLQRSPTHTRRTNSLDSGSRV